MLQGFVFRLPTSPHVCVGLSLLLWSKHPGASLLCPRVPEEDLNLSTLSGKTVPWRTLNAPVSLETSSSLSLSLQPDPQLAPPLFLFGPSAWMCTERCLLLIPCSL